MNSQNDPQHEEGATAKKLKVKLQNFPQIFFYGLL